MHEILYRNYNFILSFNILTAMYNILEPKALFTSVTHEKFKFKNKMVLLLISGDAN